MTDGYQDRALHEVVSARASIPDDVFCYSAVPTWRKRVWTLIDDVITNQVKAAFKRNPPDYLVSDDLTWLNEIVSAETGRHVEMKRLLAFRLAREYRAFRVGHGTRTNDLAQFYERGLRYLRAGDVEDTARALFMVPKFNGVTENKFAAAVNAINARSAAGGREGHLYFCANERDLITRTGGAGHYLIYGSEYLYCLGIRLVGPSETQKTLKSIGRPTMFVCDIPMTTMCSSTLMDFAGSILEYLFSELIDRRMHALSPEAGSALSLARDLPPEHIVGHYHPARVYDPL